MQLTREVPPSIISRLRGCLESSAKWKLEREEEERLYRQELMLLRIIEDDFNICMNS